MKTGIVIFAHGSPVEPANEAVRAVASQVARQGAFHWVGAAFLGGGEPDLRGAIDAAAGDGAERIVVIPYFLTLGLHMQRDLPRLIDEARRAHGNMSIEVTPPLDGHPALVSIVADRAQAALNGETNKT